MRLVIPFGLLTLTFIRYVSCSTYAVAMLGLEIQDGTQSSNTYKVVMFHTGPNPVNVSIETIDNQAGPDTRTIPSGTVESYDVPLENVMNGSELANKTVIFTSSDEFILQIFTSNGVHTEGLLGIPIEELAGPNQFSDTYEYIVNTFCATSGYCQLSVTSHTQVDVKVVLPGKVNDVVFCIGMQYFRSWRDQVISLDRFDALQIETTHDLTGTHIYSMGVPVVVYVGSRNVTKDTLSAHMLEQLTPSSHWGTHFGLKTFTNSSYGDIVKISANWPNTLVKMQGFPDFVINNVSHVVSRRLDKDMVTYIEASHPVQVMQIVGIGYASSNEAGTIAMTTVPAVEHGVNTTVVACGDVALTASFTLISAKTASEPSVHGIALDSSKINIRYWTHNMYVKELSSPSPQFEVTGDSVSGMVTCDGKAILPLNTLFKTNLTIPETKEVDPTKTCIEGEPVWTLFEENQTPTPGVRSLNGNEVIKLWTRVCGEVLITLDQSNNSIVVRLTADTIFIDLCHSGSCEHNEIATAADGYNTDYDCERDMAIYWFKQMTVNQTSVLFCFGAGPTYDSSDKCSESSMFNAYFNTDDGALFEKISMVGLQTEAFFLMDLEPNSGCSARVSDWRCEDKIHNCSSFGKTMCTDSTYSDLAENVCKKYCGKCETDNYGKKFIVVFLTPGTFGLDPNDTCRLYVTLEEITSNITVVSSYTEDGILSVEDAYDDTYTYDCKVPTDEKKHVTVRSNSHVSVTVVYWISGHATAYTVYPVDAFDKEFMSFSNPATSLTHCKIVTEDIGTSVVAYHDDISTLWPPNGQTLSLNSTVTVLTSSGNALNNHVLFKSNSPVGVFCGYIGTPGEFNPMLPTSVWGTTYRIPALGDSVVNRPFNGKLVVQALKANTFFSIDGDFNSNFTITTIGEVESDIAINLGHSYVLESNYPVAVGLTLTDSTDATVQTFMIIPPTTSFDTDPLVFVPGKAMSDTFTGFGAISFASVYQVSDLGNNTNEEVPDLTKDVYVSRGSGTNFGLSVVVSSSSKWLVVPGYTKFVAVTLTEPTCVISTTIPGDSFDNDCDLLADEDICYSGYGVYGEDFDIDGDFNEDCKADIATEPVVVAKDDEPVCIVIDKPPGQCWVVSQCKCSWVENNELMQNMSTEEFNSFQKEKSAALTTALSIKKDNLASASAQFVSKEDKRQSATNIGYLGIALFTLVFGCIFIMDVTSLIRDMRTFGRNFSHGVKRLWNFIRCK